MDVSAGRFYKLLQAIIWNSVYKGLPNDGKAGTGELRLGLLVSLTIVRHHD